MNLVHVEVEKNINIVVESRDSIMDKEIKKALKLEEKRQSENIELIASEN